jgi:4,5-DOPA dioxygenase extradiol
MTNASPAMPLMPAAFIGHGTPMNALGANKFTAAWRVLGDLVPRPRAVLIISAHWYVPDTLVTAMDWPPTIHDFYGFPAPLYEVRYPAPGLPEVAAEIIDLARPFRVSADTASWGFDHGSWAVMIHVFPDASVPVLELSVNAVEGVDYHFELGMKLAELRQRGVLVIGSGQVVNDQRGADRRLESGYDWANDFDAMAQEILLSEPSGIARLMRHPNFSRAAPSPDHFWPLVQFAGITSASHERAEVLVEGVVAGSISMTCFTVGLATTSPG